MMNTYYPSTLWDFQSLDAPERILLGPGPSLAYPDVLKAISQLLVGPGDAALRFSDSQPRSM
jgi:hypothetical protein